MDATEFCELARRLMSCPAAPYHESLVRAECEKICDELGLQHERDQFGNVLVRLQTARDVRPVALAAHLDHPAFEILKPMADNRWAARFLGGVPESFFDKGIPVRLMPGGTAAVLEKHLGREQTFVLSAATPLSEPPTFAVWELEDFALRDGLIVGRACDDLIGVAAVLAAMADLKRSASPGNVIGVISRAEEVGYHGALAVAGGDLLPKDAFVISLETSRELPAVKMGQGVILRVGDRTAVFDSTGTRFLSEVANEIAAQDKTFSFQRALMSGGSCEGTAYQGLGYQTVGVCVALGNYHNCGGRGRIEPEFVNVADALGMARFIAEVARQMPSYETITRRLPEKLAASLKVARTRLVQSGEIR
ncbi:MAG: M20/M25/M40 family metallo-hydrolase [Verrucomicrobia bacterium]|nr:M20/M25/M40 family metallo-hydrolase [Verrucomicrobiota bacterium]